MPGKRELIDTGTSKRSIRRDDRGRFTADQRLVERSLGTDRQPEGQHAPPQGQGNTGDRSV